ncbi:response regulator transcription factor [Candidatus Formimonas warabiya]|uniref:Stage 0 sporulation protein A homolog n=1 Tax=Formimonas warabiya TaxID=1761012 RepID=A0A3G1L004_FORW1|nr:response regulator [Candidatus Formimonas warabiya]ATW27969.1 hypothetical protein DCMF_27305 [Candidatus Formimonas warabiya]
MIKVMVVDDDPLEGETIHFLFAKERPKVQYIGQGLSGHMGIELAQKTKPHIAFVDIKMPGIDGLLTTKLLKEMDPALKIVIITAFDEFDFVLKALKMGASDYLLKPARPQEILHVIDKLCEDLQKSSSSSKDHEIAQNAPFFVSAGERNELPYEKLTQQVQSGEIETARESLANFWQELKTATKGNIHLTRSCSMELATAILHSPTIECNTPEALALAHRSFINGMTAAQTLNNMEACLKEFIENCLKVFCHYSFDPGYELISRAKDFMEKNSHKNITLETVAKEIHLSPFYFSRLFKEKTSVNFVDYLIELRLEKARLALLTSNDTVASIAKKIGYAEVNSFSRLFKNRLGVSPSAYRLSNKNYEQKNI